MTAMLGEEEHQRMGSSLEVSGGRHSVTAQTTTRRLVSDDSLRRQRPGQGVLVYRDLPPLRLTLRPWYGDRWLKALHDGPESEPRYAGRRRTRI
jgi:hypothetical protein